MRTNRCVYACVGASNHTAEDRQQEDYYATDPIAGKLLLEVEPDLNNIWECACGEGHLSNIFENAGKLGKVSDLIDRGYKPKNADIEVEYGKDFTTLNVEQNIWNGDIVTNPPYAIAEQFVRKALALTPKSRKVCMFLRTLFLEGQKRKKLFEEFPPKVIYVSSSRISCAKNGDFETYNSGAQAYSWFVWEVGYKGETIVKWIN